ELADAAANVVFSTMGAGVEKEEPNVYQDPQGRFTLPLIGNWTQVETDEADALFEVP
ncbi:MAG: hypothetical protein GTO49_17165, partial [Anaerolineae bacterium]|nr:hypothetical protein [Anaerolineae bacterium]